jgi:hypothetical protein
MKITNLSTAFNTKKCNIYIKIHQSATYAKTLSFDGALPLQPIRLGYNMKTSQINYFILCLIKPEDLENMMVSSLLSLVANTGLGLVS